jgi:DNA-binding NtrC family response regulator
MGSDVRRTVLVVEDDDVIRDALKGLLSEDNDVVCVSALATARRLLGEVQFDALVLDLVLNEEHGEQLLHELASRSGPTPAVVVVSASKMAPTIARAYAVPVLTKPFDADQLLRTLADAIAEERRPHQRI